MRPPERIPLILERLRLAWEKHPDLRLGQLVANACAYYDSDGVWLSRIWNIEDEKLIEEIER